MSKQKICLFTAHAPNVGGGAAILRSLIANLPGISIEWYYIGNNAVAGYESGYLGPATMGGPMVKDIFHTWQMLTRARTPYIDQLLAKLLAIDCDAYWIVSHNEGLRVATALAHRQSNRPVHMTVHDDWAGALCARSLRYRLMTGPANKLTKKALQAVHSFDVISAGMRDHYQHMAGRAGAVCHRYLPAESILPVSAVDESDTVLIGHIGSIYDKQDLFSFLELAKDFYEQQGKTVLLQMWGCHLAMPDVPAELQGSITFFGTLAEDKVIPELAKCSFVYCMYPLSTALRLFSKTSLPTKLSSYLQAARPIFGHGPGDSTLAEFLSTTALGSMWATGKKEDGMAAFQQLDKMPLTDQHWQQARLKYFGESNLETMTHFLTASNAEAIKL